MMLVDFSCFGLVLVTVIDLCLAQWSGFQQQQPPVLVSPRAVQNPPTSVSQSKQGSQGPVVPLTWRFPVMPEVPQQPDVPFEPRLPVVTDRVAAQCGENFVRVEVKKDLFGTGQLVNPSFLTLGGCAAVEEDQEAKVLIFQSELQTCGSSLTMTNDELVYTFTLFYTPEVLVGSPVVKTNAAAVGVECHYPRLHNVSSNVLKPSWVSYAATKVGEDVLVFSLKLMTDDWMFERPSNQYILGQFLNLEASVQQYNHVPLRIFVGDCVATAVPDVNSSPRYSFIENYGCLIDAKLTGSTSSFMRRVQNDKLQFQLEAFRFQQPDSGLVYITCALRAVMPSTQMGPENKACSFNNGWTSVDGNDQVCVCCDSTCGFRRGRRALPDSGLVSEGKTTIGPIVIAY